VLAALLRIAKQPEQSVHGNGRVELVVGGCQSSDGEKGTGGFVGVVLAICIVALVATSSAIIASIPRRAGGSCSRVTTTTTATAAAAFDDCTRAGTQRGSVELPGATDTFSAKHAFAKRTGTLFLVLACI
jgi:hypothetical protein